MYDSSSDLVLQGHDRVVLGGVDVQDVVVVLSAQVVGDVGEGGAGRLGHAVVDDDHVILAAGQRCRRVPLPQAVLRVPLLDLSYLMAGDGSFWGDTGEFEMHRSAFVSVFCYVRVGCNVRKRSRSTKHVLH